MKANYSEKEIQNLLVKVRIFNNKIGTYEVFAITDNFDYVVKTSNGKILLKIEELQDDGKEGLTRARLEAIAARFVSSEETVEQSKPFVIQATQEQQIEPKKKRRGGRMFLILLIIILVFFAAFKINESINKNNNSSSDSRFDTETYEEKVMTVEEMEAQDPMRFLSFDGKYRENFLGTKLIIEGSINNNATVVSYKDVVLRVQYYSKTNTRLEPDDYTIWEVFPPTSSKSVDLKVPNYSNVGRIEISVVDAKVR